MSTSECRVLGCLRGNRLQNFQFEFPKMKLCEFVRVPMVNDWARFAFQISKDEAPMTLLTVGLLFIFGHLSYVHLETLEIHSVSQMPLNFEQRTLPEVVDSSRNKATSHENPIPACISRYASMECLLAGWSGVACLGKKSGQWGQYGARWVKIRKREMGGGRETCSSYNWKNCLPHQASSPWRWVAQLLGQRAPGAVLNVKPWHYTLLNLMDCCNQKWGV